MSRLYFLRNMKGMATIVMDGQVYMHIYQREEEAPRWIRNNKDWNRSDFDYIIVPTWGIDCISAAEELALIEAVSGYERFEVDGHGVFFVTYHA